MKAPMRGSAIRVASLWWLLCQSSLALPVSAPQASNAVLHSVAMEYPAAAGQPAMFRSAFGMSRRTVMRVERVEHQGEAIGYAVSLAPSGYYLVSTDDELPPWKLRADEGDFYRLPPGLLAVLKREMAEDRQALQTLRKARQSPDPKFHQKWQVLLQAGGPQSAGLEPVPSDEPGGLLTTQWNQDFPYNQFCPPAADGPGGRAYAGCSACALAQILRYYQLPGKITGEYSYSDDNGVLTGKHSTSDVPGGLSDYDWVNMPDTVETEGPQAQRDAIARLMYHCAVTLDSDFEASGTTAYLSQVPTALQKSFGYTNACISEKSTYTSSLWYNLIAADIEARRPVYYAMHPADGSVGHAVVCDGCRGGSEIHLNLGWGGAGNAWYNLDSVKANGHVWTVHSAVFGITPPGGQPPRPNLSGSSLEDLYAALIKGGRITFAGQNLYHLTNAIPIRRDTILDAGCSGASVVFSGSNLTWHFTVCTNVTLQLINITLSNGRGTNGGAILNQGGTLVATMCVFSNNLAMGPAGADGTPGRNDTTIPWKPWTETGADGGSGQPGASAGGGAIYGFGTNEFYRCRFEFNSVTGGNGGRGGAGDVGEQLGGNGGNGGAAGAAFGGAVYCFQRLVLSNCTFAANQVTGGNGGPGGQAGATLRNNPWSSETGSSRAGGSAQGGAVYSLGKLQIWGCTFVANLATGGLGADEFTDGFGLGLDGRSGGAACGGAILAAGPSEWVNCTFFNNAAQGGSGGQGGASAAGSSAGDAGDGGEGGAAFGGALYVLGPAGATNCTFARNSAWGGEGGLAGTGSLWSEAGDPGSTGGGNLAVGTGGKLTLKNCIVANSPSGGNGGGKLVDAGHNLSSDATCGFTASGSRNNVDPMLGDFGSYGGDTPTIPLLVTTDDQGCQGCNGILLRSPALDAGEVIPGLETDQRGVLRPQGAGFDIGAYEAMAVIGQVKQFDGEPFTGVTISLSSVSSPTLTTVTDDQGRYQIVVVPDQDKNLGVYRVEPTAGATVFSPPYVNLLLQDPAEYWTQVDFVGTLTYGFTPEGAFHICGGAKQGRQFRVEAAETLPFWYEIGIVTVGLDSLFEFTDSHTPLPLRFYRVVSP